MLSRSILQYFGPALSYHLSLRPIFGLLLSGGLRQVLLYIEECCVKQLILFYSDNDSKKNSPEETKTLCFRAEGFLTENIYRRMLC